MPDIPPIRPRAGALPNDPATQPADASVKRPKGTASTTPDLPPRSPVAPTGSHPADAARGNRAAGLREIVADPSFAARDPRSIPVPQELLDAIQRAKTVLVVSHTNPDGDATGSSLALARMLESLGKERVDVCIDDDLPGPCRVLDSDNRIVRASSLRDQRWDLAIVIDVAVPKRIGGAVELLARAETVAVVDHHVVDPKREDFELPASSTFLRWIEPDFPAAGLLALALISHGLGARRKNQALLSKIYLPALAAFATDTGFGRYQGLDPEHFRFFKYGLQNRAKVSLEELERQMKFELPEEVAAYLDGSLPLAQARFPKRIKQRLAAAEADGGAPRDEILLGPDGRSPAVGIITVSDAFLDALAELGRAGADDPPHFIRDDVFNRIKWGRPGALQRRGVPLTVLLSETGKPGQIGASVRARTDAARRLAESLGGGGHDVAAGAMCEGTTIAAVRERVLAWAREQGLLGG